MSQSCGACGAFGILLSGRPELADLFGQLMDYVNEGDENGTFFDKGYNCPEDDPAVNEFLPLFIEALAKSGIEVPDGAGLLWTGNDDERPASCDTSAGEFVLGFGLFTMPWQYPEMADSFKDASFWHTWVWMSY